MTIDEDHGGGVSGRTSLQAFPAEACLVPTGSYMSTPSANPDSNSQKLAPARERRYRIMHRLTNDRQQVTNEAFHSNRGSIHLGLLILPSGHHRRPRWTGDNSLDPLSKIQASKANRRSNRWCFGLCGALYGPSSCCSARSSTFVGNESAGSSVVIADRFAEDSKCRSDEEAKLYSRYIVGILSLLSRRGSVGYRVLPPAAFEDNLASQGS